MRHQGLRDRFLPQGPHDDGPHRWLEVEDLFVDMDAASSHPPLSTGILPSHLAEIVQADIIQALHLIIQESPNNIINMKAKPGFKLREVCGEQIIVAEGRENIDFTNIISMNETSAFLWNSS